MRMAWEEVYAKWQQHKQRPFYNWIDLVTANTFMEDLRGPIIPPYPESRFADPWIFEWGRSEE